MKSFAEFQKAMAEDAAVRKAVAEAAEKDLASSSAQPRELSDDDVESAAGGDTMDLTPAEQYVLDNRDAVICMYNDLNNGGTYPDRVKETIRSSYSLLMKAESIQNGEPLMA